MRFFMLAFLAIASCSPAAQKPERGPSRGDEIFEEARAFSHRLPEGNLYDDPELDRNIRGIYASGTAALDDEALWPVQSQIETFRLTVLPSFSCPYLIRLDVQQDQALLTLRGGGRYIPSDPCDTPKIGLVPAVCIRGEPGPLLVDRTVSLTRAHRDQLVSALRTSNVMSQATPDPVCDSAGGVRCLDGTIYILEARSNGQFHYIKRNSMTPVIKVFQELSGIQPEEVDAAASERGLRCAS